MKSMTSIQDHQATPAAPAALELTRTLALGAVAGPVLFTLAWFVLGLLRADYSSVRQPISLLGIGPNGPVMNAAFMLGGLLLIVGVLAVFQGSKHEMGPVARWAGALLLVLSPLGLVLAGLFTVNHFALHLLGAQLACDSPIITFAVVGLLLRRVASWRRFGTWLLLGSPLTLVLLVGFIASVPPTELATGGGNLGLWQRALGTEIFAWYVALGWLAYRRS
jgi:hypothetical membrane protein